MDLSPSCVSICFWRGAFSFPDRDDGLLSGVDLRDKRFLPRVVSFQDWALKGPVGFSVGFYGPVCVTWGFMLFPTPSLIITPIRYPHCAPSVALFFLPVAHRLSWFAIALLLRACYTLGFVDVGFLLYRPFTGLPLCLPCRACVVTLLVSPVLSFRCVF